MRDFTSHSLIVLSSDHDATYLTFFFLEQVDIVAIAFEYRYFHARINILELNCLVVRRYRSKLTGARERYCYGPCTSSPCA